MPSFTSSRSLDPKKRQKEKGKELNIKVCLVPRVVGRCTQKKYTKRKKKRTRHRGGPSFTRSMRSGCVHIRNDWFSRAIYNSDVTYTRRFRRHIHNDSDVTYTKRFRCDIHKTMWQWCVTYVTDCVTHTRHMTVWHMCDRLCDDSDLIQTWHVRKDWFRRDDVMRESYIIHESRHHVMRDSYMSHDSHHIWVTLWCRESNMTWRESHMTCAMTHSNMRHDSFTFAKTHWDARRPLNTKPWHNSFPCVPWLIHITQIHTWRDSLGRPHALKRRIRLLPFNPIQLPLRNNFGIHKGTFDGDHHFLRRLVQSHFTSQLYSPVTYGVATISSLLEIIGLFCKRAL